MGRSVDEPAAAPVETRPHTSRDVHDRRVEHVGYAEAGVALGAPAGALRTQGRRPARSLAGVAAARAGAASAGSACPPRRSVAAEAAALDRRRGAAGLVRVSSTPVAE